MCATCVYVPMAHSYTSFLRIIIPLPWDRNRRSPRLHGFKRELHARVYVRSPGCFSQQPQGFYHFLNLSDFAKLPSKNGPWTGKYLNTHISTQLLFAQPLDSRRKWYFRGGFFFIMSCVTRALFRRRAARFRDFGLVALCFLLVVLTVLDIGRRTAVNTTTSVRLVNQNQTR